MFSFACDNNKLFLGAGDVQVHCFTKSATHCRQIIEKAIKGGKFDLFSSQMLTQSLICVILILATLTFAEEVNRKSLLLMRTAKCRLIFCYFFFRSEM